MADSDDEYDRKRRDKFRGERSAGGDSYRSERRDERRRDDWPERGRNRPDYRDYRGARDRYSPGRDLQPPKRMRPDWGDEARPRYGGHDGYGLYGWGHDHYPMHGGHGFGGHPPVPAHQRENQNTGDTQTQPPMLTLKQFLDTQDDGISDSEVLRKYSDYKLDFKRQQLNEFFVAHKDEEWFKNKYHPEESLKRKEEQLGFLKNRVDVFTELLEQGVIPNVTVDTNQIDPLLRLLDTVVIKLEGGTEDDLKILDEKAPEFRPFESKNSDFKKNDKDQDDDVIITGVKSSQPKVDDVEENWSVDPAAMKPKKVNDDEENWDAIGEEPDKPKLSKGADEWDTDEEAKPAKEEIVEKKRSDSESSDSSSNASKADRREEEPKEKEVEEDKPEPEKDITTEENTIEENIAESESKETHVEEEEEETEPKKIAEIPDTEMKEILTDEEKVEEGSGEQIVKQEKETTETTEIEPEIATETIDLDKEKDPEPIEDSGPRALHRTSSIFLRNLAPTITKAEIEGVCRRYNGFLRVAIADPLVERRWFRRGWVTFKRDVNIKEICWNLNNIRLRDCELGAIVNRDLSRRVRPVNGITAHKTIVRSDIKLCAKIAHNLDEKFGLWLQALLKSDSNGTTEKIITETFGFNSKNPVLQNITDYLIEEASAEEDELLGLSTGDNKESSEGEFLEREPQLISVLDKLILYLRIVHSVDFYNHCEYPYEDEMPNRCGIIHARGPPPQNKVTGNDIQDYIKNFEGKMSSFLAKSVPIEEDELKNLGCKDPEAEVEKFIQANTQELAKDKWLCPLSGKKFKGPEFIRKHIFNKHGEKVDEVRKEVDYFNNYLKDAKRPQLPEHPGNTRRPPAEVIPQNPYRPAYPGPAYAPPYAAYAPTMVAPPRPRGFGSRRGPGGGDYRAIIHYRDLDAPREPVDFL